MWFHVDGAYGALAAQAPGAPESLRALSDADSVAVDPHKWLYAPLEAGCVLVRDADKLRQAFSYHPAYYHFDDQVMNYFDYGPQNSRGFRALKVWLALRQVGRAGYLQMIGDDMLLARHLHQARRTPSGVRSGDAEPQHHDVPLRAARPEGTSRLGEGRDLPQSAESAAADGVEKSGEAFLSNAVVGGRFAAARLHRQLPHLAGDIEALPVCCRGSAGRSTRL